MHNLFLGTAKQVMETWMHASVLTSADLQKAQDKVDSVHVPTNIGRIPGKIAKSFSGFTTEQWKMWVAVFSPYALNGILPDVHYRCWLHFVKACRLICTPLVELQDVASSYSLLVDFCRDFEKLYGKHQVTPNMHLHVHLADCIFDYGPVCGFWLFSFERYNGILGEYYTNKKSIDLQLMQKFTKSHIVSNLVFPNEFNADLQSLLDRIKVEENSKQLFADRRTILNLLKLCDGTVDVMSELWFNVDAFSFGAPHTIEKLDVDKYRYLREVYQIFFPSIHLPAIPEFYDKYASTECAGEHYGSKFSRLNRSSFVLAKWADRTDGNVNTDTSDAIPGIILYFAKRTIKVDDHLCTFCFARVSWFQYQPRRFYCGSSGISPEVWCANLFDCFGASAFVSVQRILGRFLPSYDLLADETVLYVYR